MIDCNLISLLIGMGLGALAVGLGVSLCIINVKRKRKSMLEAMAQIKNGDNLIRDIKKFEKKRVKVR